MLLAPEKGILDHFISSCVWSAPRPGWAAEVRPFRPRRAMSCGDDRLAPLADVSGAARSQRAGAACRADHERVFTLHSPPKQENSHQGDQRGNFICQNSFHDRGSWIMANSEWVIMQLSPSVWRTCLNSAEDKNYSTMLSWLFFFFLSFSPHPPFQPQQRTSLGTLSEVIRKSDETAARNVAFWNLITWVKK